MIEARRLTVRFGDVLAVDDVSFTVGPGEVVGLLGANGAGKTTSIRVLLGLLAPSSGQALLAAEPPSRTTRARLGYVPQGLGLYPELTVAENVAFVAAAYRCPPAPLPAALQEVADDLVASLPLGLRRQVAFHCSIQHHPDMLILDEPTSGMEPLARALLWDDIRKQAHRGVAVLVTTHYMSEARQCDRLVLLADGRVVATGTETDIVADTRAALVTSADWAAAFDVLVSRGYLVTLAGRDIRVVNPAIARLRTDLLEVGIAASVTEVPATIEERMTLLG